MSFDNTIKLVKKQHDVLVDVIQWLDEKNFSNSEIRSQVDSVLNHEGRRIKEKAEKYWRAQEKYFDSEILKP